MNHVRRLPPLMALLAALALTGCVAATRVSAPPPATSITTPPATQPYFINVHALIIVRHADISIASKKTMGSHAPLTERGEARAKELAYALKDAGITRIVTSETLRTQQTAAVLAAWLALTPETPFAHGGTSPSGNVPDAPPAAYTSAKKKEAVNVLAYLQQTGKPGDTILLVHHHSVIPGLLELLGCKAEPPFAEDTEFDRLYLILPDPSTCTYRILRLRYGGKWQSTE